MIENVYEIVKRICGMKRFGMELIENVEVWVMIYEVVNRKEKESVRKEVERRKKYGIEKEIKRYEEDGICLVR